MSVRPDKVPRLRKVASPVTWSWYYFRMRYLPMATSGLAVATALWLWAINLPDSTSEHSGWGISSSGAISNSPLQAGALLSTNTPDLQTAVTNGNLGLGGGL